MTTTTTLATIAELREILQDHPRGNELLDDVAGRLGVHRGFVPSTLIEAINHMQANVSDDAPVVCIVDLVDDGSPAIEYIITESTHRLDQLVLCLTKRPYDPHLDF